MGINIGVNNVAKNVNNIFVGVDGKARQVKKAYVGVNNIARLVYNADSKSDSNIMFYGVLNGADKVYLNNNKDYSLSLNSMTEYASGTINKLGRNDMTVSKKGTFIYVNPTYDATSVDFYKIEEGKVSLYDTITQADFPTSIIGSGNTIQALKLRGCCFSYDEKHLYITSYNIDTSTSNYTKRMYISSFNVTPSGFSHISTAVLTSESDLYFTMRGSYVAVSEIEDYVYVALTYQSGSSTSSEMRAIGLVKINSDFSLFSSGVGKGGNSYPNNTPGKIEVTPDGKWAAIYYDAGWSSSTGSTRIAYVYYFNGNSLSMVTNVNMSGASGIMRLCADKLLVYQNWDSYSYVVLYVYNLKSDGTWNYDTISISKTSLNNYDNYLLDSLTAVSRDGTILIASNGYLKRYIYKINYATKGFSYVATIEFPNETYRYCAMINE